MLLNRKKMFTAQRESAQEKTQTTQNTRLGLLRGPPGRYFAKFGFLLGRLAFGGDHFVDNFFSMCFVMAQTHHSTIFGICQFQANGLYEICYLAMCHCAIHGLLR